MLRLFYQVLFWTGIAAIPLAFAYNIELFRLINCPRAGGAWDTLFLVLTSLSDGLWIVMIATVVQSIYPPRHFGLFVLAMIIGNIFLQTGKLIFDAPRPALVFADQICILGQRLTVHSFPSGHSFSAILLFMHLRPRSSFFLTAAMALFFVLAVLSRAYVGAHFPRDMAVGAFIAVFAYIAAEYLIVKFKPWRASENTRRLLLMITGLGTALVYIFAYHEKTRELEYILTPLAWLVVAYWVCYLGWMVYARIKRPAA